MSEKDANEHAHYWIRNLAGDFAIHGYKRPYVPRDAPDFEYFALAFEKIFSHFEMHAYRQIQKGFSPAPQRQEDGSIDWGAEFKRLGMIDRPTKPIEDSEEFLSWEQFLKESGLEKGEQDE